MPVLPTCPNDGRPITDGAYLCDTCGKTLRHALTNIVILRGDLELTITRRARIAAGATRPERGPFSDGEPTPGARFNERPIPHELPLPVSMVAVEVAYVVDNTVTTWARDLIETTGATLPPYLAKPPLHPTAEAALLLYAHVNWWRHRKDGPVMYDEILGAENDLKRAVDSHARDWMSLGECPVEWPDPDGIDRVCGGTVMAWPAPADLSRAEQARVRLPKCARCGTEATVDWWHAQIMGNPQASPLVTAPDLIAIVAWTLHWTVTHEQLRQWKHRDKITAEGRDAKGRTLYRHGDVIAAIRTDVAAQRERAQA